MFAYIGSRTTKERNACGEGITICEVDANTGQLHKKSVVNGLINPSYLALSRDNQILYVIHGDINEVSSFAVNQTTGELTKLDFMHCGGRNPVHLAISPDDKYLIISNHLTGNVVSIEIHPDGKFGRIIDNFNCKGEAGPHRIEQPFAKPHFNGFDTTGNYIIIPDKGLDTLFCLKFENGKFSKTAPTTTRSREGAGPRHFAQHPMHHTVYVVNELDSSVGVYLFDNDKGILTPIQVITTLDSEFVGNSRAAAIVIDKSGKYLYVSNRGADCIAIYAIDSKTFKLSYQGFAKTNGKTPRFITMSLDGQYLYVLHEDSHDICQFSLNTHTGSLEEVDCQHNIGSPVCLVFLS